MSNLFDVVALDDDCTRFACQRELSDCTFETIGNYASADEAQIDCDLMNEAVEEDNVAWEDFLAPVYNPQQGGAQ